MSVLLHYNESDDMDAATSGQVELGRTRLAIEGLTSAGRALLGGDRAINEDAFSVIRSGDSIIAAVFDGASSQKPIPEIAPSSGARYASHSLKQILETLPASDHLSDLLSNLNRSLREYLSEFSSVDWADTNTVPSSMATLARIDARSDRLDITHVGDTYGIVLYRDGTTAILTDNLHQKYDDQVMELIKKIAQENAISIREARQDPQIKPAIMEMLQYERNRPDGTGSGAVNGDPNMDQYIHTQSVKLSEVEAILLGTDGLIPAGMDEQKPADQKKLFEIALNEGLEGLVNYIRKSEDDDPEWKFARYKHSDDATGVLIRLA